MKNFLLCIGMLSILCSATFSAPNTYVGIHKGDVDGFSEITVSSTSSIVLISTGVSVNYIYTDWSIKNYGTYDIYISTCPKIPANAKYRLEVGESISPQGIVRNKAIFGKGIAGNSSSIIYVITTKYSAE